MTKNVLEHRSGSISSFILAVLLGVCPALAAGQREMIDADWRKQDGIGMDRQPSTYSAAAGKLIERGSELVADLQNSGVALGELGTQWDAVCRQRQELAAAKADESGWEGLWTRAHELRRKIIFSNPLFRTGPMLFVKQSPGTFSHQLTQVYGRYARPGGGLFVLDQAGESFQPRPLTGQFSEGSFQTPEVSFDGKEILFAYCSTAEKPVEKRFYHVYRMNSDGTNVRQLTDGPYDDFSPRFLPGGQIVFVSTRRGGFHRCGSPGCPVYTLATMNGDGGDIRMLSHHEVQEWDPCVLGDGRLIYTRWDYVDRHAVFGEHLWTCRPDGTSPMGYYGNYTLNPVGTWEAQPVPGSRQIMATAAAHHAMTAGSIVLIDVLKGYDGQGPLTRLTPETPFPESEFAVGKKWFFKASDAAPADSVENLRWPGHCYKSPLPLSEKYFVAAYSFDPLVGEPLANCPSMFGLYAVDRFGNKELIYRDPEISSLWPALLRERPRPPVLPSILQTAKVPTGAVAEGAFIVQSVYSGRADLLPGSIKRLRIVQVLPKTTSGKDNPPVGAAAGAPGKAVLGTVAVEEDGSAYFTAPANVPLLFQALDDSGQAVQVMRSATYLQAGETQQCVGCHEPRQTAPAAERRVAALGRGPSAIEPGPDGSRPFCYPILVQGILDKHCVRCHDGKHPEAKVSLTGEAQGRYTVSYNVLVKTVPYASDTAVQPQSRPGQYGARGSSTMKLLLDKKRHYDIALSREEIENLATWMDTNALFYGTFDPSEQKRQQRGERIALQVLQ